MISEISEEDKRATTKVQNGLVFFFLFSFILFYSLWTKTAVKPLNYKKSPGGKILKKCEKVWKSVEKCQKVWKSAETILPFSCCPLVFLWKFRAGTSPQRKSQKSKVVKSSFFEGREVIWMFVTQHIWFRHKSQTELLGGPS